jgi:hypothetical protein
MPTLIRTRTAMTTVMTMVIHTIQSAAIQ